MLLWSLLARRAGAASSINTTAAAAVEAMESRPVGANQLLGWRAATGRRCRSSHLLPFLHPTSVSCWHGRRWRGSASNLDSRFPVPVQTCALMVPIIVRHGQPAGFSLNAVA